MHQTIQAEGLMEEVNPLLVDSRVPRRLTRNMLVGVI